MSKSLDSAGAQGVERLRGVRALGQDERAETTFIPDVIVQAWRSWQSTTPGSVEDALVDAIHVDALRRRLEEHVGGLVQERERAGQDEQADERRGHGVGGRSPV